MKQNLLIVKIGVLTGLVVVIFESINLFVIYRHIKLDYYLTLVALFFLTIGLFINKKVGKQKMPRWRTPGDLLTTKEIQILQLVAEGKTNKEIAGIYFIEVSTVKTHINNIYSKLSLKNRKEARVIYNEIKEKGSVI